MTYIAKCCRVEVIGRLVWIALGVPVAEEKCPCCGKWTQFTAVTSATQKPVFGQKKAA